MSCNTKFASKEVWDIDSLIEQVAPNRRIIGEQELLSHESGAAKEAIEKFREELSRNVRKSALAKS